MPALLNSNLFIHRQVRTNGFNNLICIAHPVTIPGTYYGNVYTQKTFLGRFQLDCDANSGNRQVNVDGSHFDPLFRPGHAHQKDGIPRYSLAPGCPLVLHATAHHDGLYVILEKEKERKDTAKPSPEKKTKAAFDSRQLMAGDAVMLRPTAIGDFMLRSEAGQEGVRVHVKTAEEGKYYHPSKLEVKFLTVSSNGFDEKAVEIQPFQLVIVKIDIDNAQLEFVEIEEAKK